MKATIFDMKATTLEGLGIDIEKGVFARCEDFSQRAAKELGIKGELQHDEWADIFCISRHEVYAIYGNDRKGEFCAKRVI